MDDIQLNFNPTSLAILNCILGFIMFGVALDMKLDDFKRIVSTPKAVMIGLVAQFLVLPALTFGLIYLINPRPSIALGMMLVAACPGGNISNFMTHYAKGNTALSVTMSSISTLAAVVMTPLNFTFWASMHEGTATLLKTIALSPLDMLFTIFVLLGLPMLIGIYIAEKYPSFAARVKKGMKIFSLVFFGVFVLAAIATNWSYFVEYIGVIFWVIVFHNAIALMTGYSAASLFGIDEKDKRAVAIEVGIQNSGLGLVLIFNFFDGLGGMAIIAAGWGIWHLIAGLALATYWSRKPIVVRFTND